MKYSCKKVENCFADSQTWEYRLPISGEAFSALLPKGWAIRRNTRLRRPVFIAALGAFSVKGVLDESIIKVSFPSDNWEKEKHDFEEWLEKKNVEGDI